MKKRVYGLQGSLRVSKASTMKGHVRKIKGAYDVKSINEGLHWMYTSEEREAKEMKMSYLGK